MVVLKEKSRAQDSKILEREITQEPGKMAGFSSKGECVLIKDHKGYV